MNRRIIILVILVISIGVSSYGADALYRTMHGSDNLSDPQDALIIGKIIKENENDFEIEVAKVINGVLNLDTITVNADFDYWGMTEANLPKVSDNCVLSIDTDKDIYEVVWCAIRVDSLDYERLKIEYETYISDFAALQRYINSDGKDADFYFVENRAYLRLNDEESIEISLDAYSYIKNDDSEPNSSAVSVEVETIEINNNDNVVANNHLEERSFIDQESYGNSIKYIVITVIGVVTFGAVVIRFWRRKH